MILSIGEILFDIFPGYKRIGGAPFNFAYHSMKMGVPVAFISKVGDDSAGKEILEHLDLTGLNSSYVQLDRHHKTGKVIVSLDSDGNPHFDIVKDVAYDFIEFDQTLTGLLMQKPDLIYIGSLAQRSTRGFKAIQQILSARDPGTCSFYDVNLRPGCYTEKIVKSSLMQSDVVKMSQDELKKLKIFYHFSHSDRSFMKYLMEKNRIEMVSLTKGKAGSELFLNDKTYQMEAKSMGAIADTVGAGDAYAAVVAMGYLKQWHPNRILAKATELAGRICTIKGAIPRASDFYDHIVDDEEGTK